MFKNEVIINSDDKEKILNHIKEVNRILDKYPFQSCLGNTVTTMSRAKAASEEAEKWISYLYTQKN